MKNRLIHSIAVIFTVVLITASAGCAAEPDEEAEVAAKGQLLAYGVFIGTDPEQAGRFAGYDLVVIDAAYYAKADIDKLHREGTAVYSYLNVGSLEDFRDFFSDYQHLILGEYENWPGEYWVDVSAPEWQDHIQTQASQLVEKGVDGFFIDNADVYYNYHTATVFEGMTAILNMLGEYDVDIIINGGDVYVTEAVIEPGVPIVKITGINQECVFTNIDFENGRLIRQSAENKEYYQQYVEQCAKKGLAVYLLEYSEDVDLIRQIEEYCNVNRFGYYVSQSIDLQ
jgi:Uncharacterized conserved protein